MLRPFLFLMTLLAASAQPAFCQGIAEGMVVRGAAAGLGAGLAAGANHGRVIRRSYESMCAGREYAAQQTAAINKYTQWAVAYEAKKQYGNAELLLKYVLHTIALRDGPGSTASLPVLKRLVHVEEAGKKLDEAVRYQQTIVAFAESRQKVEDMVSERNKLTEILIGKNDYTGATPVMEKNVALVNSSEAVTDEERETTMRVYGRLLSAMKKKQHDSLATKPPAETNSEATPPPAEVTPPAEDAKPPEPAHE